MCARVCVLVCVLANVRVCMLANVRVCVDITEEKPSLYERLGTKKINRYLQTPVHMDTS